MNRPVATRRSLSGWTPLHWLTLLLAGACAAAGWAQAWKWQRQANALEQERSTASKAATADPLPASAREAPGDSADRGGIADDNPTLSLMQDVDLMNQIDLLTKENERLSAELKKAREAAEKIRQRSALDGSSGAGILR